MKILCCFKSVPDPADASKRMVNPFDEIAIEEALRLRERSQASEVVAVTIGAAAVEEQIRSVLGMGCDRAIRVDDDRSLDPFAVARILRAVIQRESPTLVLMGKQAIDDDCNQVGQMLAGLLGWPQATFISKLELIEPNRICCTRETDAGLEVIAVRLPAVVTADLRLNEPRYVSLPGLIKARRKPIEVLQRSDIGAETISPRTQIIATTAPPRRPAGTRVAGIEELLARLHDEAKVI